MILLMRRCVLRVFLLEANIQSAWNLLNHGRRLQASGATSRVKAFACVRLRTKASSSDSAVVRPAGMALMALWNCMLAFGLGGAVAGVCHGCYNGVADVAIPTPPRTDATLIGLAASSSKGAP